MQTIKLTLFIFMIALMFIAGPSLSAQENEETLVSEERELRALDESGAPAMVFQSPIITVQEFPLVAPSDSSIAEPTLPLVDY